jgi:hypothetical protein
MASISRIAGNGGFGLFAFILLSLFAPFSAKIFGISCCQSLATKQAADSTRAGRFAPRHRNN